MPLTHKHESVSVSRTTVLRLLTTPVRRPRLALHSHSLRFLTCRQLSKLSGDPPPPSALLTLPPRPRTPLPTHLFSHPRRDRTRSPDTTPAAPPPAAPPRRAPASPETFRVRKRASRLAPAPSFTPAAAPAGWIPGTWAPIGCGHSDSPLVKSIVRMAGDSHTGSGAYEVHLFFAYACVRKRPCKRHTHQVTRSEGQDWSDVSSHRPHLPSHQPDGEDPLHQRNWTTPSSAKHTVRTAVAPSRASLGCRIKQGHGRSLEAKLHGEASAWRHA